MVHSRCLLVCKQVSGMRRIHAICSPFNFTGKRAGRMKPLYERKPLCFSCSACGDCCTTGDDYYVYLNERQARRIRKYLKLSSGWFRRRYLERLDTGDMVVASTADGRCIFLDANRQCRIYGVRPLQCRTYPFWPELTGNLKTWQAETRRCEGINRGKAVPVARIRRAVNACLAQESGSK